MAFRKQRGHAGMPKPIAALRSHDTKLSPAVVDLKKNRAIAIQPLP